jgi:hypothetical protein
MTDVFVLSLNKKRIVSYKQPLCLLTDTALIPQHHQHISAKF